MINWSEDWEWVRQRRNQEYKLCWTPTVVQACPRFPQPHVCLATFTLRRRQDHPYGWPRWEVFRAEAVTCDGVAGLIEWVTVLRNDRFAFDRFLEDALMAEAL